MYVVSSKVAFENTLHILSVLYPNPFSSDHTHWNIVAFCHSNPCSLLTMMLVVKENAPGMKFCPPPQSFETTF